jgi:Leucine-rich repeat (LRR) protein
MKNILLFCVSLIALTSQSQNVYIPDQWFKAAIIAEGVDKNKDGEIQLSEAQIVGRLTFQTNNKYIFNSQGIEAFTSLYYLSITNTGLKSLDISKNILLQYLYCSENKLTSLDLNKNTALLAVDCSFNPLTTLDVSENILLKDLGCVENQLTSLDISKNTSLLTLACYNNKLSSLNVSKNILMTNLNCYNNQLTSLDVSKNTDLYVIGCEKNQLTSLDITQNVALLGVSCSDNQISYIDISKNPSLNILRIFNNKLSKIDGLNNKALDELYCSNNLLTSLDISKGNLVKLDCKSNPYLKKICLNKFQLADTKTLPDRWLKDNSAEWTMECSVSITDLDKQNVSPKLVCIYNLLGQEVKLEQLKDGVYIYLYNDGNYKRIWNYNSN